MGYPFHVLEAVLGYTDLVGDRLHSQRAGELRLQVRVAAVPEVVDEPIDSGADLFLSGSHFGGRQCVGKHLPESPVLRGGRTQLVGSSVSRGRET